METTTNHNTTASLMHLSALSQFVVPFGNFILPIIIWTSNKDKSAYVDAQGKQVINFQLSIFLYQVTLALIAVPIFLFTVLQHVEFNSVFDDHELFIHSIHFNNVSWVVVIGILALVLCAALQFLEFVMTIYAAVKTSNGADFKYPLTIHFLK